MKFLFNLPHKLWIVGLGLGIFGFGCCFALVLIVPEINSLANDIFPNQQEKVADMTSGLFNGFFSLGQFFGPLISGLLSTYISIENSFMCVSFTVFGFLFIYLTIGGGYKGFLREKKNKLEKSSLIKNDETTII